MDEAGPGGLAPRDTAGLPERRVSVNQVIALNVAEFRRAAGLTQGQLGERLPGGWSTASVSAAERSWDGRRVRKFDADELAAVAKALGVPVAALFLPPPDSDTKVHYRFTVGADELEPGELLALALAADTEGDTPAMAAYRERLMALGAARHLGPSPDEALEAMDFAKEVLDRARQEADIILAKTRGQSEQITSQARARAVELERDAQERHRHAMGSLVQSRAELERRIDDLRAFEAEYRRRLLAYMEGQVRDLKAGVADQDVYPPFHPPAVEGP